MANESKRKSVAVDRLKSLFESDAMSTKPPIKPPVKPAYLRNATQNGSISSLSDKGKDSDGTDMNSNSLPGKSRNSQVNIPAAFLQPSADDKVSKPKPPPPARKPVDKDNEDKPIPSWKKSDESKKPDPPWKRDLKENLADRIGAKESNINNVSLSSDETKKPDPPWKKNLHRNESESQEDPSADNVKSEKPIPAWKQAILDRQKGKEQEEEKNEKPVPPWKAKKAEADDKQTPPWKAPKKTNDENIPANKSDKPIPPWKQKANESKDQPLKPTPPPSSAKPKSGFSNVGKAASPNKAELENIFKNLKPTPPKKDEPVLLRGPKAGDALKRKMSRKSYTRVSDEKKFILIDVEDIDIDSSPPPKPARLVSFSDLEGIIADYKAQLEGIVSGTSSSVIHDEEEVIEEDIYEPIPADEEEEAEAREEPAQLRKKGSTRTTSVRAPSLIPTMDSDEEEDEYQDTACAPPLPVGLPSTDVLAPPPVVGRPPPRSPVPNSPVPPRPPPKASVTEPELDTQEEYTDCDVLQDEEGSVTQDDVYEPLDDIQEEVERLEEEKKKEDKEEMKRKEAERKKKEEEEKKEAIRKEKQRKEEEKRKKKEREKLEKEQKTIIKKLELKPIDLDKSQGEGIIKKDDKVAKFGLEVKAGERVVIIKINNCAPGKWVCKNPQTGLVGYVECENVEIDNNLIKSGSEQVMVGGGFTNTSDLPPPPQELLEDGEEYDDFSAMEEPQEEYDDIQNTAHIEPVQDDIYEPV